MAKLTGPDLPPGAVVAVDEATGEGLRNDGGRLKPAARNPWYVLATIAEEQTGALVDPDLHAKNRRYWNGWACAGMDQAERSALAEKMGLPEADLAPLTEEEDRVLRDSFAARLGSKVPVPAPDERIDFRETHFANSVFLVGCVFVSKFYSRSATFSGGADFESVTFGGEADFGSATFSGYADFGSATFSGGAFFVFATFGEEADFSNQAFAGRTDFDRARFDGDVPTFYQRQMHQDTVFPTDPRHWPKVTADTAGAAKRAYARLRQIMNELQKPDEEHFFFRQEMACKALEERWWNRWPIWLFWLFSNYGYSLGRPLVGLAVLLLTGAAAFFVGAFRPPCLSAAPMPPGCGWEVLGQAGKALGLSFANIFPFGLNRLYFTAEIQNLPAGLKTLGGAQTVLGFVLLFFLGLGLRNRFRLK